MFGHEHWHILALAVTCMLISWRFSEKSGSKVYYLMDSGINLKLPKSSICLPARRGNCLVFLLKDGVFFLWKDGQELEGRSPHPFEPLSPTLLSTGFACWAKGRIVWFNYGGQLVGNFPIPGQGVSLMTAVGESLVFGTTLNTLYYWKNPTADPVSLELLGIPLSLDNLNQCLFTSSAAFYDLSEPKRPILIEKVKREVLGGFRVQDHIVYFDDRGQIFAKHITGSEKFIDYYNRDFFYPQRAAQKVVYTNRERQCLALEIIDSEVQITPLSNLSSTPAWLRWFGPYLMVHEESKSGQSLIKIDCDGDVSRVSMEGLFVPLGIDETRGIFHYRVNDTWYEWDFSEQTPRELKMDCPEQILFYEGNGYKKVGASWFGIEGQLVSQLTANCHDGNYAHQVLGLIPYNAS